MAKRSNEDLRAVLSAAQNSASGTESSGISTRRAYLIDRYNGEKYGDEIENRSQYIDTSIRDDVETIKAEIMDIFFGGDQVVEFSPVSAEDVEAAEQETVTVNHVFSQMNEGFTIALGWFHDALTVKNGYIKRSWQESLKPEIEGFKGLTPEEAQQAVMSAGRQGEVEVQEWGQGEDGLLFLTLKITPKEPHKYIIENVPPEEVVVHPEWTRVDFEGCPFVAHRRVVPSSDLIAMGFSRKQVESLQEHDGNLDNQETIRRFATDKGMETDFAGTMEASMREVLVYENYIRYDRDGDGVAELLQVYTGGEQGEILKRDGKIAIEEVDAAPFNVLCPLPIPHKHYGLSLADLLDADERTLTVLHRQMLDNVAGSNNPDIVVQDSGMTEQTVAALEQTGLARVIEHEQGPAGVNYMFPPDMVSPSLAAINQVMSRKEQRTGVTRLNQGLDADSLNKTFGGQKALMSAAQKRVLLYARVFAETGFKSLFADIHRDMRKGPLRQLVTKLRNEFVPVNPRTWASRSDMTVNVGLGTGDRDVQFQRLGMVLNEQKEGMAAGLVEPKNIHHTLTKMLELSGFKDSAAFFPKPPDGPMPQPEPAPDPAQLMADVEVKKIEAKAMDSAAKIAADGQAGMAKLDQEEDQFNEKLAAEAQARREDNETRIRIAEIQAETQLRIAREKIAADRAAPYGIAAE